MCGNVTLNNQQWSCVTAEDIRLKDIYKEEKREM